MILSLAAEPLQVAGPLKDKEVLSPRNWVFLLSCFSEVPFLDVESPAPQICQSRASPMAFAAMSALLHLYALILLVIACYQATVTFKLQRLLNQSTPTLSSL